MAQVIVSKEARRDAVLQIAPEAFAKIFGAGDAQVLDFAAVPRFPNFQPDTFTASGMVYITNNNPKLLNYGYTDPAGISGTEVP